MNKCNNLHIYKFMTNVTMLVLALLMLTNCDALFGSKNNPITGDIFTEGKLDPKSGDDVVGYAALLPFWSGYEQPNDIFIGYDELVYITDDLGIHVSDLAGRRYRSLSFRAANAVTQDRNLNVFVSARDSVSVVIDDSTIVFDLPVIYKIRNLNGAGELAMLDTLILPFDDASLSTYSSQIRRLNRSRSDNYEQVEITGLTSLTDNTLYATRTGPANPTSAVAAPDNTVLIFQRKVVNGVISEKMENKGQIRALHPTVPSLVSAVGLSNISSFIGPPQRERLSDNRGFLVTQSDQNRDIPYRAIWINAVETVDGLVYSANTALLEQDTSKAHRFLYETNRFINPTGIAYAPDGRNHIFITDAGTDSLYLFQSNGYEGVVPPAASNETKAIIVSFGGKGSGPKQFDEPSAVAYFRRVIYVADKNNGRISRYKLTTDFE